MADVIRRDTRVVLHGRVEPHARGGLQITNPQYEVQTNEDGPPLHTGRTVRVYEKTGSLTARMQRALVHEALTQVPPDLPAVLPNWVERELGLPSLARALRESHFPEPSAALDDLNRFRTPAQIRVILEEFFHFQLGLLVRRRVGDAERKPRPVVVDDRIRAAARSVLPFSLTSGQRSALKTIVEDMVKPQPMHRLLQGDVGSGKTIVAVLAAVVAMANGLQVAFMVPTEILADQHALTLRRLLEPAGYQVGLLSGSVAAAERRAVLDGLAAGTLPFVVGTQALVQQDVAFAALGLAVIDEQHRFGLHQRMALKGKGASPDVLIMTATPIPRTLALTYYGDLDVVVLDEMPQGRQPISTRIARSAAEREAAYRLVRAEVGAGRQAFVVCAAIDEGNRTQVRAAEAEAERLATDVFPDLSLELLHGRMRPTQKEAVMEAFRSGRHHLLISTTVIEVGVDVPNATVMLVENAERFGLAQLHQLRGRIGRGEHPSTCILFDGSEQANEEARARLDAMVRTTDGFELADEDLRLRGEGTLFDVKQSGMPDLRLARLALDVELVKRARARAFELIATDPELGDHPSLLAELRSRFERSIDWLFHS
jgi:ATP-dependent DNA helicase RecG